MDFYLNVLKATDFTMITKHLFFDLPIVSCSSEFFVATKIIYLPIKYLLFKKKVTSKLGRGASIKKANINLLKMNDTLLYLKWITNKDLLCSTWNYARCYVEACMEEEFGGERIHVYVWLSPFAVYLKLSQHCSSAMLQYKIKS